jgi:hypothetical protein
MWFPQAEAQFTLAGISSEKTKFCYAIPQLDHRYASEVEDIIISPQERDPYTTLRTELVGQMSPSKEQRICHLFTRDEMGDCKPSQFLRHLTSPAPHVPEDFLHSIWLPSKESVILPNQPEGNLDAAAHCADDSIETAPPPTLNSVAPLPESNTLWQHVEDLSRQVEALSAELPQLRSSSRHYHPHLWMALLRLNLQLRQNFTWRFVVVDITHPLIILNFHFISSS